VAFASFQEPPRRFAAPLQRRGILIPNP
jgi:hypothetical protein